MDTYTLLKLTHIVGFIMLGSGVFAIFLSEWQTLTTHDVHVFAEAARFNVIFRNCLIAPGSVVLIVSGPLLILELDLGFFEEPWVFGMWALFLMEAVEGNLVARRHNRRTIIWARHALETGALTPEIRRQAHPHVGVFAHVLDLPILAVIVYCGAGRPESWTEVAIAFVIAIAVAAALSATIPRLHLRAPQPA